LNGRWTLTFEPQANRPGFGGSYRRVRNGKLVAAGSFSLNYTQFGAMLGLRDFSGPSQCDEIIIGGVSMVHLNRKVLTLTKSPAPDPCRKRFAVFQREAVPPLICDRSRPCPFRPEARRCSRSRCLPRPPRRRATSPRRAT
jgi:hypothetical protein